MESRKVLKILIYFVIIINSILIGFLVSEFTGKAVYETEKANVTRVIDGDTIDTSLDKVRLLGINSPEKSELYYNEAKSYLQNFEGKEIELIRTEENKDKYSRLLRYVFYKEKNINEEILKQGLAHLYYYDEDEFTSKLEKAEEKARNKELGIWKRSSNECAKCIILVELNHIDPGEYVLLKNTCLFSCNLNNWFVKDDATHIKKLDFSLSGNEERKIDYSARIWNDAGDSLYLRDDFGLLVLFYRY